MRLESPWWSFYHLIQFDGSKEVCLQTPGKKSMRAVTPPMDIAANARLRGNVIRADNKKRASGILTR